MCEDITIVSDSTNEVVAELLSLSLNSNDSAVMLGQSTATLSIGMSNNKILQKYSLDVHMSLSMNVQLTVQPSSLTLLLNRM